MPEVAESGSLIIDPLDTGALTSSMFKLATDSEFRADIEAGARFNAARFSWERAGREIEEIFLNVKKNH